MVAVIKNAFTGWSVGYSYATLHGGEQEIKQGKNYYAASATVLPQAMLLGTTISKIAISFFKTGAIPFVTSLIPVAIFLPVCAVTAVVKHDNYTSVARKFNNFCNLPLKLPEKLDARAIRCINFLAEHTGDIIRIAMITAAVALVALGNIYYGGACLLAIGYQVIDQLGWVPYKISLFIETYMPLLAITGLMVEGGLLNQINAIMSVPSTLPNYLSRSLHHVIDQIARKYFNIQEPALKELDAPLRERRTLNFQEINKILDAEDSQYMVAPAHCTKWAADLDKLPIDNNFGQFLDLFDSIQWDTKYEYIKRKLYDDDYFIDFLKNHFPNVHLKRTSEYIDNYIQQLARDQHLSVQEYAKKWARGQMLQLVSILTHQKRASGSQQDLADAISNCEKILPYLKSLTQPIDQVEKEDMLLKLAIEGGDYCARGIKRASDELLSTIFHKSNPQESVVNDTPMQAYESKLRQALQVQRLKIVGKYYKTLTEKLMSKFPDSVKNDIHVFDLYRTYLTFGFYPVTDYERRKIGFSELFSWLALSSLRQEMYNEYSPDDVVKEIGTAHFTDYIVRVLSENTALSDNERNAIIEKFTERNNNIWTVDQTNKRFYRLMYVMLGIMQKR